jgi:hypothetical protein
MKLVEAAIVRVEMESLVGGMRMPSKPTVAQPPAQSDEIFSEKYQGSKTTNELQRLLAEVVPTKADITAALGQGLAFVQRTQLKAKNIGRRIFNIFGDGR